jgi:hypothetical protein
MCAGLRRGKGFSFSKLGKRKQETPLVRSDIRILPFWKFMINAPDPKDNQQQTPTQSTIRNSKAFAFH